MKTNIIFDDLPLIQSKTIVLRFLIALALIFFALAPGAQAVSPPPDGGYPGFNTAEGQNALLNLTSGAGNTGVGWHALSSDTTASFNTAVGAGALFANTGDQNTVIGAGAGLNLTTGSSNICIGSGVVGVAGENNTIHIGSNLPSFIGESACFIGGIWLQPTNPVGVGVFVDYEGRLGTTASSKRFKHHIKPIDKVSEAILALKPVTFHYKSDTKNTSCFGLIAEEVAQVNAELVVRDKEGKPYSVRYDQVNAMLLNEFLKEHKKVEQQQATLTELKSTVAQQQKSFAEQRAQIQALAAGLQKVSAQIEMSKSTPTVVVNRP